MLYKSQQSVASAALKQTKGLVQQVNVGQQIHRESWSTSFVHFLGKHKILFLDYSHTTIEQLNTWLSKNTWHKEHMTSGYASRPEGMVLLATIKHKLMYWMTSDISLSPPPLFFSDQQVCPKHKKKICGKTIGRLVLPVNWYWSC